MRIVLVHEWGNYEASGTDTRPFEYESPEAALVDFERALNEKEAHTNWGQFEFAGMSFNSADFKHEGKFYPPEFLTVDEWFNHYGAQA